METGFLRKECRALGGQLIEWRRALHRIPETGIDLPETEAAVRQVLRKLGLGFQESYKGIGVVGLVRGTDTGGDEGRTVGIRADMDALEIEEEPGREYGSGHHGRMHACGHDAHMAIALGAARFLQHHKKYFSGAVKFIFQPGEENTDGAKQMLEAGVLDDPRVDVLLGLHIGGLWEELGTGQIGLSHKAILAAADTFDFQIESPGGHGAMPHKTADPVLAAAAVITGLHNLVGREIDPVESAVITVGRICGGRAYNVIPTVVRAGGTVRTFSTSVRERLEMRIGEVISQTAEAYRCGYDYSFHRGTPAVQSDPAVTGLVAGAARDLFGPSGVREIERPSLVGEDVSFFLNEVPGCFFGLGASNPDMGILSRHHSPVFDIDESVLWKGTAVLSLTALRLLKE